jgi:serine O-acetyltransferase
MPQENNDTNIRKLVSIMMQSYSEHEDIIEIETKNQINKSVIIDIIENLRSLIFAGFFEKKSLRKDSLEYYVGELLEHLIYHLQKQISIAVHTPKSSQSLQYEQPEISEQENNDKAAEITYAFLERIPEIRKMLDNDVTASYDGDPAALSKSEIILSYPGIYAVTVYRIAHELYNLNVPLIPRMMTEYAHGLTGIDIHPGASIGHHFFIDHGTGIVIGETTVIGNYVKIYQGVTLGALSTRGGQMLKGVKRHPVIEDHVTIYSGASILGGSTIIGESVVIGSNAFIVKSVPEQTKVSVKNPELQFKSNEKEEKVQKEFNQEEFWDFVI